MRTFTSPSGRQWSADVVSLPASPSVLRFRSESLVLELAEWPADWESLPEDALVALVRRAQPPSLGMGGSARVPSPSR